MSSTSHWALCSHSFTFKAMSHRKEWCTNPVQMLQKEGGYCSGLCQQNKYTIMQMVFGHLHLIKAHRGNYIQVASLSCSSVTQTYSVECMAMFLRGECKIKPSKNHVLIDITFVFVVTSHYYRVPDS